MVNLVNIEKNKKFTNPNFFAGSTNDLSSCVFCCNFFHLRCHKHVFSSETLDQSENICPICLRKKQRETILLKNQQRGNI